MSVTRQPKSHSWEGTANQATHHDLDNQSTATCELKGTYVFLISPAAPLTTHLPADLVIRALGLPNYRLFQKPKCFARIMVDGEQRISTQTIHGSKPEWNASLDM
jgi:hypothetical protein